MYKFLFVLAFLLPATLFAQPTISYSNAFLEPNEGHDYLHVLNNGNTVWMHIGNNIMFKVYDTERKQILSKVILHKTKMGADKKLFFSIKDAFETNDELVVFIQRETAGAYGTFRNVVRTLFRVIINPATGEAKEFLELASADIIKRNGYDIRKMVSNDIHIAKDPSSGAYAILRTNGYTQKGTDRVKVWVYGADHKLQKEAVVNTPANDAKFIHLTGFVFSNNTVFVGTTEDDAKRSKSYDIPYYISKLGSTSDAFETIELAINPSHINSKMTLKSHPETDVLYLVTTTKKNKKLVSAITCIDPNTLSVNKSGIITGGKLAAYTRANLNDKAGFDVEECNLMVNPDGSALVITESTFEKSFSTGKNTYTKTYVEKLGLMTFDKAGNEINAIATRVRPDAIVSNASASYFAYKIQNIKGYTYLFINDIDANFENAGKDQYKMISSISDANTIMYKLNGDKFEKTYLYGEPEDKKASRFAMIGTSYYSETNNTLVSMIIDRKNNVKTAKLAWAQF